jgi:anti-sigma factor ChrR (cupin superfamily)
MSETSTVVRTGEQEWRALETPGVAIKVLRVDKATGESTALLRFDAGASFPAHNHPRGEEIFVIAGDFRVGREHLRSGDYL